VALTYSIKRRGSIGDLNYRIVDVTLDAAYAAGGYTLSPQQMGFGSNGTVFFVLCGMVDGFLTEWDEAASKLKVRDASGGVGAASPETANNLAGLNGLVVRLFALGIGHG
jgi:hypothetical protein